jgi:steroid delta-isomerase-like uncharacterized protein
MDHTATMKRTYELINSGDLDGFGALVADDMIEHEELPGYPATKEGVLGFFRMLLTAFPDMRMDAQDILPSGDKLVARVRATGTQKGEFMGVPPTGKAVDIQVIDIIRFGSDGLAHEHWGLFDAMKMMQQLGVVPS